MSAVSHKASAALVRQLSGLLGGALGAIPMGARVESHLRTPPPIVYGLGMGLAMALLFCGVPWLIYQPTRDLFWLSAWGAVYFAFAVSMARFTSSSALKIIENNVIPELSAEAAAAISRDLAHRFGSMRVTVVSCIAALASTAVTFAAIARDLFAERGVSALPWAEIGYQSIGFFILYITAARTTDVARFYGTFADHLKIDANQLYKLDPARSAFVTQIAAVARRVLFFWFGISCSVATLFLFLTFSRLYWVVLVVVPTASLFSIGVGTAVFLKSENDIRAVVNQVTASTLRSIEAELADLFKRRDKLEQLEWTRLKELMSMHTALAQTGWHRSAFVSALSIIAPFAGPIVSILIWMATQAAKSGH